MTQAELAELLGVKSATVSGYETEKGGGYPSFDVLIKLSEIFKVSLDDLVFTNIEEEGLAKSEPIDREKKIIAKNISYLRSKKRMSQIALGQVLNLTNVTISKYESETIVPPLYVLDRLKNFFDVSLDDLVYTNLESNPNQAIVEDSAISYTRMNQLLEQRISILERHIKEHDPEGAKELGI